MEGHNNFAFMPDELSGFDDLIHNAGWPAEPSQQHQQQQFSFVQPNQDPYSRFTTSQPAAAHGHYNLNQPQSYPSASYSNSPYASQYQHARPSDVFGPSSFNVDPSLQASTFHGHESAFSFPTQPTENATIAPQSLQYSLNHSQPHQALGVAAFQRGGIGANFRQQEDDPSTVFFQGNTQNAHVLSNQTSNIRYPTLRNENLEREPKSYINRHEMDPAPTTQPVSAPASQQQQQIQIAPPPRNPLRTTHPELLDGSDTSTQIRLQHAPFLAFEDRPIQVTLGSKNTIPKYRARNSRSGKDIIPGYEVSTSLPAKVSSKRGRPPKVPKSTESQYAGTSQASRALATKVDKLRVEDQLTTSRSPSTPTETSSSEDESDSSEESEYEEDEMPVMDLRTIRGESRPKAVSEAARYDAIGIVWRDAATNHGADVVKDAIEKFATFFMSQRAQIKANAVKMDSLAKDSSEYKELEGVRADLLASLYETINAAIEHGYSRIVQNLGGHHKLVNGLTSTLIDCNKVGDMKGQLPRAVFKLLAKFQTMSDELLQKAKFEKLRTRWERIGDEEITKAIETILANTTNAKQRAADAKQDNEQAEKEKNSKERVDQTKFRASETTPSQPANSAKRPHEADGSDTKPSKKIATETSGTSPSFSKPAPTKRVGNNLLGISSKPISRPVPKKREASPPQASKLGAILASIEKRHEDPKVAEAPPRPPETPEEKARRERKESRKHLRVKFKEGAELEQIKLFKHERAEDEGRQDEMLRDAHDDRLEGMMHKKQSQASKLKKDSLSLPLKTNEDEDEYEPSEASIPYQLTPIDVTNKPTPFGEIYVTRGGSRTFTTAEQETQRKREGAELMVIYTTPGDIPPTPKELTFTNSSEMEGLDDYEPEPLVKSPTEPWLVQRLHEIQQYGPEVARHVFKHTQPTRQTGQDAAQPLLPSTSLPSTLSAVFPQSGASFQQGHQSQPQSNKPGNHLMDPAALANILRIVDSLKNKPFPPTEPPDWMTDQAKRDEWIAGYMRDNPVQVQAEATQRMAQMQTSNIQPSHMLQHLAQQPPQMAFQLPVQQPGIPAGLSTSQIPDVAHQMPPYFGNVQVGDNRVGQDYGSWAGNLAKPSNESNNYTNQGQSRWENNWTPDNTKTGRPYEKKQRGGHITKQGGNNNNAIFDERGEYKGKKRPCRFYQDGKCAKGAACTYLHDD